ncbi:MAG: CBS domain-containing protein [Bacteroidota bacterium]|nr:CBS domain-containing protein [Bacteroidota bacterium]
MLAQDLINTVLPQLKLTDTVDTALQLMNDYKITHLPVVSEEKYLGMISEDHLLDEKDRQIPIEYFQNDFIPAFVNSSRHFLSAVTVSNHYQTNLIPVVSETHELMGSISGQDLLAALGNFSGANEPGAVIVLEMERVRFSISEISRIVESDGAQILHLNITIKPGSTLMMVTLHLNKRELSTIVASFERYEYNIIYYAGEEQFENKIDLNYKNLMNYLDI